jgi:hypothetical protein
MKEEYTFRSFENRVLKRISGPKWNDVIEGCKNIMKNLVTRIFHYIVSDF